MFLSAVGLPFSWKKCQGGTHVDWVGYHLDIAAKKIGISAKRARWIVDWIQRTCDADEVSLKEFASVLGRLNFTFAAVEALRPFLGPLYSWHTAVSHCERLKLPKVVRLVLVFLQKMLQDGHRVQTIGVKAPRVQELFRTDAKAEGNEVWIGGWAVMNGTCTNQCRWFSERLTRHNAKWAFIADEPFRAIASLELLATLVGCVLFGVEGSERGVIYCSAATDNFGNACVLNRLLTTKFPLMAFLMEIAARMIQSNVHLCLQWTPRLQNREADSLTNEDYRGFDPKLRLRFSLDEFEGIVMNDMLEAGAHLFKEVREGRKKILKKAAKRARGAGLRETDPWC